MRHLGAGARAARYQGTTRPRLKCPRRRRRKTGCDRSTGRYAQAMSDPASGLTTDKPATPAELLPLVYDELRELAAAHLASEPTGHTLQPTALVHEVYLRLASRADFPGRSHFLAAAGEAMRRLLIDHARKKR